MKSIKDTALLAKQAAIFKALAQQSRLQMVLELGQHEHTVGELTALVGLDASTVSRHLSLLKSTGIISSRREGKSVIYRLAMPCVLGFFACAEDVLHEQGQLDDTPPPE